MSGLNVCAYLIVAITCLLFTPSAFAEDANRYNVLFIAVDDLRPELGCYGSTHSRTPHLDRLAANGTRFTNHFVQVATCGASRYALLTGRSPSNSGVTASNDGLYNGASKLSREKLPGAKSMPELFRRSGYHTVCIGKISHTPDGKVYAYNGAGDGRDELPGAWSELATPYGPWKRGWGTFFAYADGKHREDGQGHSDLMQFTVERDEDLPDGLMAQRAIEKLKQFGKSKEPFFMGLGFFKPHLPWVATKGDWEAMAAVDVGPPPHPEKGDTNYWHGSGEFHRYKFPFEKSRPLAQEDQITARRAYLACVRYADRQIGKVLDALDENGLADSTIVVVWGDHGWHLGDSQIWGKHTPLERALRSPLIFRVPGVTKDEVKCEALAETLDIYPTLIELCQPKFSKTQHPLDGRSLAPILRGERESVRDAAISYWRDAISVRTPTHRLIGRWKKEKVSNVELYDIRESVDPVEDIAAEKPEIVEQLQRLLPTTNTTR